MVMSTCRVEAITPEEARRLLPTAPPFPDEAVAHRTAEGLAAIMERGEWVHGSSYVEVINGRLSLGRHRMLAVIMLDRPVDLLVKRKGC